MLKRFKIPVYTLKEQDKIILIKNCILKAEEALSDAEYNLKDKRYSSAFNRIYYAIFYSVMALAYKEDFTTSKHSQLLSWFNKRFVYEEKIFDSLLKDIYKHAYKQRQESDYNLIVIDEYSDELVLKEMQDAKYFFDTVLKYLRHL